MGNGYLLSGAAVMSMNLMCMVKGTKTFSYTLINGAPSTLSIGAGASVRAYVINEDLRRHSE